MVFPDYNLFRTNIANSTFNWLIIPKNVNVTENASIVTDRESRQTRNNSKVNLSYFNKII